MEDSGDEDTMQSQRVERRTSNNEDSIESEEPLDLSGNGESSSRVIKESFWKNITIEPMMLAHMIAIACSSIVVQNMYLDRICRVTFQYNDTTCADLSHAEFHDQESKVEGVASLFTVYRGLIEAGFPILFSLFLGPWTDVHGTKYPILLPLLGYALSASIYFMLTYAPDLHPGFILFASIPVALTGGMVALIMSVFSFISKITSEEDRSFRVAMLEAAWFLGGPIGLVTGGYIYKYGDFRPVFVTSGSLYMGAFIYGAIVIKEAASTNPDHQDRNCISDMFNVEAVKEIFWTVLRVREGKTRSWIGVMLLAICLRIFVMMGYLNTMYLYTRNKFHWSLQDYTEYSVSDSFIAITGSYIMIMLTMKIFKLNDALIGIIGSAPCILGTIIFAFASEWWMVYLGAVTCMFAGLISIVIRSMLSKVVAKEEVAKVFTFLSCGEASMPLLAVPLYNFIFIKTKDTFPGCVFLVTLGGYFLILLCFIYLYISMKNHKRHELLEEEESSA